MAYAALASVLHITEQILNPDPYPIPFLNEQIESLHQSAGFLLDFLESCSNNSSQTVKCLEIKIRDAAYNAEDALECQRDNHSLQTQPLEKVIEEIEGIMVEVKKIQDGGHLIERRIMSLVATSSNPVSRRNETTVEIDKVLMLQIRDQLAGQRSTLEVIPIVGMGGIGKTTLARTLFNHQSVIDRFDVRAWVTVSQEYRVNDVVRRLLDDIKVNLNTSIDDETNTSKEKVQDNGTLVHKTLKGRRYLIVLDDVWNTKAWDDLRQLFPNDNNESRIMLTTRHKEVASYVERSYHEMKLLSFEMSWDLFCRVLFGQQDCPSELVKIGKMIVENCGGLPLAIVVIAGLLSKQNKTEEYWEHLVYHIKTVLIKKDKECSEILSLSYNYLPHHLKPCFLYMGFFPEDYEIHVSKLIKLWIAEGFLRPDASKSLERVAQEYLEDLVNRNLILVHQQGSNGNPKTCSIHDLLREICIREAQEEKFLYVLNRYKHFDPEEANNQRRLSIHPSVIYDVDSSSDDDDSSSDDDHNKMNDIEVLYKLMRSMSITRSFMCPAEFPSESEFPFGSELLRVLDFEKNSSEFPKEILKLVNLRYLELDHLNGLPSSISNLWNLQTLIASDLAWENLPLEIWDMTQLRHIKIRNCYIRVKGKKSSVLKNLQTLSGVLNFKCRKKVIARIPNLRRLKTTYNIWTWDWSCYRLYNLDKLCMLESLSCHFDVVPNETLFKNLSFPSSLIKLTLRGCQIPWEHMTIIGKLPNLEVVKLQSEAFGGPVWEPNEGEFEQLNFLCIEKPVGLQEWRVESSHFPRLKHLILREVNLEEMSSSIEEIASLEMVELFNCNAATNDSCREIEENGGVKVIVHSSKDRDDSS